ncbi:hypothetical protein [Lewinella sp. LCG006]|uniref:hypothetical protein n=1 Tax=Lewinella sp. LCG006 TaxID=3231911 RepID=UPI00345F69E6
MAQLQWTVPGYGGKTYLVGLYHGEDSGHLMVHCNNKVMLVDFGVKASKDYSFFLDEELFEVKIIEQKNGTYSYEMVHNEEIDSPHNRRREESKKSDRRSIFAGIGLVVFIGIIFAFLHFRAPAHEATLLAGLAEGRGVDTQVSIFQKQNRWYANYRVDNEVEEIVLPQLGDRSPLGFPLAVGDQFSARYAPTDTDLVFIDWHNLVPAQLERYFQLTMAVHAELHPEISSRQVLCQLQLALALEGAAGLAKFYRQDQQNQSEYNRDAYLRLVRGEEFKRRVKECL